MLLFRRLIRECRMSPFEVARLTLNQALAFLDDPDTSDPHQGHTAIQSPEELMEYLQRVQAG